MEPDASHSTSPKNRPLIGWRPILFCILLVALAVLYFSFKHHLSLASRESALQQYNAAHPWKTAIAAFAVFVVATGLSIPYASVVLPLACGWLFGVWEGVLLSTFALTSGDMIAFLISRYLLRDAISHRFDRLMHSVDEQVDRDGAFYLLSLRLVHIIPSWLVNLLIGWTTIRVTTFWWATQIGTLPATIFYVYSGQQLKSLHNLEGDFYRLLTVRNICIFVALAIVPLVARRVVHRFRAGHADR